jgi:SMI1-KNR4 cell-wall
MGADVIDVVLRDFSGEIERGQGATAGEIADCERALNVRFVGSFAQYLRQYGWLTVGLSELFGLGTGLQSWRCLKDMTLSERTEIRPPLPPHLVTFYNDGFGNQHCLDTSAVVDNEHRIVFWNHEAGAGQIPEVISNSFANWLGMQIAAEENDQ